MSVGERAAVSSGFWCYILLITKPQGTISSEIVQTMFSLSFFHLFISICNFKARPSYRFVRVDQSPGTFPLPSILSISSIKFLLFVSFFTVSFHVFVGLLIFFIIVFSRVLFAKVSTFICLRCPNHLSQCLLNCSSMSIASVYCLD